MNELEKAYQEIERWHCCAEQEGFVGEEEISYLDYVKNCINNLQSKIDKIKKLKRDWINIIENETLVFENDNLIEFMNNLEDILKEDK